MTNIKYKKINLIGSNKKKPFINKVKNKKIILTKILKIFHIDSKTACTFWESTTISESHIFLSIKRKKRNYLYEIVSLNHVDIIYKYSPKKSFKNFYKFLENYHESSIYYLLLSYENTVI